MDTATLAGFIVAALALFGTGYNLGRTSGKNEIIHTKIDGVEKELKIAIKSEVERNDVIVEGIAKSTEKLAETILKITERLARTEATCAERKPKCGEEKKE